MCILTYVHTYLRSMYILTYLRIYLLTYVYTYLRTYILTYVRTYLLTYLPSMQLFISIILGRILGNMFRPVCDHLQII